MTPRPTFVQHHISPSDEAMWNPMGKVWANAVQQFPPKKDRSSWWLVLAGFVAVVVALGVGL